MRAEVLYDRIVVNGARRNGNNLYSPLLQPDRRDAAQFIFFEVAAQFESFCCDAFLIEVRHVFEVQPQRARYIMGSVDKALGGVMGWGAPKQLQSRARNLYGQNGFFARLETRLGNATYLRLVNAHKIRNRIAHSGGNASRDFNAILGQLQVPAASRSGLSVGRLLIDYPSNALPSDRWFFRLLEAYSELLDDFERYFRAEIP
ncbi:MAG: hypothetical protein AB7I79_24320 [Rhizobiaceae bacterium]